MKLPRIVFLRADLKPVVTELKVIADALALICKRSYDVTIREVDLADASPKDEPTVSYHDEQEALVEELQEQHIIIGCECESHAEVTADDRDFGLKIKLAVS